MKILISLALVAQVCFGAPPVNLEEKGRTIKEAAKLGLEVVNFGGEVAAGALDLAAAGVEQLQNRTDEGLQTLKVVTHETSDAVLKILDNKIEFILCRIFRVCKTSVEEESTDYELADAEDAARRADIAAASPEPTLADINAAILELARLDEPATGRLLYIFNEDYQTYLLNRIKYFLCKYKYKNFCATNPASEDVVEEDGVAPAVEEVVEEAVDGEGRLYLTVRRVQEDDSSGEDTTEDGTEDVIATTEATAATADDDEVDDDSTKPRTTVSLVVRRLFSHLTVRMGVLACKLRVWCPDESLAFPADGGSSDTAAEDSDTAAGEDSDPAAGEDSAAADDTAAVEPVDDDAAGGNGNNANVGNNEDRGNSGNAPGRA